MFIVIELGYTSKVTGLRTTQTFSFTNKVNVLSQNLSKTIESTLGGSYILPRLFFMQDIGNNGNPFMPENLEHRHALIMSVDLLLVLPPDCIETGKDASDLIELLEYVGVSSISSLLLKSPFKPQLTEMVKEAKIEIDQRIKHIQNAPESTLLKGIPGVKSVVNDTNIKSL